MINYRRSKYEPRWRYAAEMPEKGEYQASWLTIVRSMVPLAGAILISDHYFLFLILSPSGTPEYFQGQLQQIHHLLCACSSIASGRVVLEAAPSLFSGIHYQHPFLTALTGQSRRKEKLRDDDIDAMSSLNQSGIFERGFNLVIEVAAGGSEMKRHTYRRECDWRNWYNTYHIYLCLSWIGVRLGGWIQSTFDSLIIFEDFTSKASSLKSLPAVSS